MKATPPALEERKQPGRIRAIVLAVCVHAAFFGLIVFGVTWQSRPTPPVQAELWDKLPPVVKPDAQPPAKAEPDPPREPEKKAEPPKPQPPKPEVKPEPPKPDPKIAEKKEREKRELEKREREKLEKQKQEDLRKKREDEKRRKDEEKAKREAEAAREVALNAKQAEMQRYYDAIKAKIRGKANVPDTVTGQPEVQVRIKVLPGGDVLDIAIARSSGNRVYDTAIERAIRSAQPLPVPPADSELFPQFRDLILNIRHER